MGISFHHRALKSHAEQSLCYCLGCRPGLLLLLLLHTNSGPAAIAGRGHVGALTLASSKNAQASVQDCIEAQCIQAFTQTDSQGCPTYKGLPRGLLLRNVGRAARREDLRELGMKPRVQGSRSKAKGFHMLAVEIEHVAPIGVCPLPPQAA